MNRFVWLSVGCCARPARNSRSPAPTARSDRNVGIEVPNVPFGLLDTKMLVLTPSLSATEERICRLPTSASAPKTFLTTSASATLTLEGMELTAADFVLSVSLESRRVIEAEIVDRAAQRIE